MFDIGPTHLEVDFPDPKHTPADVIEQDMLDKEINPDLYYPSDVNGPLVRAMPTPFKMEVPKMVVQKLKEKLGL